MNPQHLQDPHNPLQESHCHMTSSNLDSLAVLSCDVFEECIIGPFLDEISVLALSRCNSYYARMLLGQSSFAMKLWKTFCLNRWKHILFHEEFTLTEGFHSNNACENGWSREYRRRRAMDNVAFEMMRDLANIENLDQGSNRYAMFIRNGLDFMDIFQRNRYELQWKDDRMPGLIENGLIRFELCERLQRILDVHATFHSSSSSELLEKGLVMIAQYLHPSLFSTGSTVLPQQGNLPDYQMDMQTQVEQELDALAQTLLRRLERNSMYNTMSTSHNHIVLEEMKFLFDEHLSSERPFSGNKDDYYSYHNSMIHTVLATRKGIPITLGIIYSAIVRRAVGMEMRPVNIPGHFMMAVKIRESGGQSGGGEYELFVDAFHGGRILTASEVESMIVSSYNIEWKPEYLLDNVSIVNVWRRVVMNLLHCHDIPEGWSRILLLVLVSWVFGSQHGNIRSIKELKQLQVKMLCCLGISE